MTGMPRAKRQRYWDYPSKTTVKDVLGADPAAMWLLEGPALTVRWANTQARQIIPDLRDIPIDELTLDHAYRALADAAYECYGTSRPAMRRIHLAEGSLVCVARVRVDDKGEKFGVGLWLGADR